MISRYIRNIFLIVGLLLTASCFQGQSDNDYDVAPSYVNQSTPNQTKVNPDEIVNCDKCDGDGEISRRCSNCGGEGKTYHYSRTTERGICLTCGGRGTEFCTYCSGQGIRVCEYCGGQLKRCQKCEGTGKRLFALGGEYEYIKCPYCKGSGYYYCDICDNSHYLPCGECGGDGKYYCPSCHGSGLGEPQTVERSYSLNCTECHGCGYSVSNCDKCDGSGKIKRRELD